MWRHLLEKLRDLSAAGRASAYERAKLCAALFADEGYLDDCAVRRRAAADELNELTNDLAVDAGALCQMLKAFPDEATWEVTPLRVVYTDTVAKLRRDQTQRNNWRPPRQSKAERHESLAAAEEARERERKRAWEEASEHRAGGGLFFDKDDGDDTAVEANEQIDLVSAFDAAPPSEKLRLLRSREFMTWLSERRGIRTVDEALEAIGDDDEAEFDRFLTAKSA